MKRNVIVGGSILGLAAILGAGSVLVRSERAAAVVHAAGVMVPKFEVDPFWPKPLPNGWMLAATIGLSMDTHDNVWIIHRPQTLDHTETRLMRGEAECCKAAPDVLEFDEAGNLLRHWGKAEGHDWPSSNHGITVDDQGNVWLGGNGPDQPGPPAGSAAQFAKDYKPVVIPGVWHDDFILKFTEDGKFLGEIGKANESKGSLDTNNVKGVATIRFIPGTDELVAADGYGNHRVSVWNAKTLKFIRMWGAYGHTPSDDPIPHYNPNSPQFANPVHCAEPTSDGYLYVCDRTNNRIQIFKYDGTYVKQVVLDPNTKAEGSVWEIAFSRDPQQKYMYVSDGANEKIHVFDRQSMQELYSFGSGGREPGQFNSVHCIVTDSHGNIFTTETYHGRAQKFIYKGLVPLDTLLKEKVVAGSLINQP